MPPSKDHSSKFSHLPLTTSGPQDCAQVQRAYQQYSELQDDLAKNTFMTSMKTRMGCFSIGPFQLPLLRRKSNILELIQDHIKEMYPIIYTPTEGTTIQNFSRIFRRPEGCFLNIGDTDRVYHDLAQWGEPQDIDYIVVTDGEEILGIGDQGMGGVLISIAKLVLTTLCAGIHANRTLAVGLDYGTDNEKLRNNDLYLGLKHPRVRGEKYEKFVETFVQSARKLYPKAYIYFEDFGLPNE
ncbi:NAD-dependent malic enzyme, mitochondrial [Pseudogymnoascus destructans]|uniref:NAD-dependent malic enzyme, mitochondrial n=1 Tax=Pseudogymnoascus destructans TaxID=655981 RepID=A0A177A850_9PEZI|nr:NAD-dependent malic enzyme, mitochondrial [Pseudogymnoascus destructans]OAF58348.1 NAD-dependent malic enzyme, mitochondrial [Pseudogymnoascus destructans]